MKEVPAWVFLVYSNEVDVDLIPESHLRFLARIFDPLYFFEEVAVVVDEGGFEILVAFELWQLLLLFWVGAWCLQSVVLVLSNGMTDGKAPYGT